MDFYLQGLALGLAYVAPIGMQNLFVINSALTQTRLRALVTALIVIFFDVTLALACFFGIGLVMQKYPPVQLGVLLLGGLVVMYIGVSLLKSSVRQIGGAQQMPLGKTVWAACVVTWFNAQAVIDGTMLLGAFKSSMKEACVKYPLAVKVIAIIKEKLHLPHSTCLHLVENNNIKSADGSNLKKCRLKNGISLIFKPEAEVAAVR